MTLRALREDSGGEGPGKRDERPTRGRSENGSAGQSPGRSDVSDQATTDPTAEVGSPAVRTIPIGTAVANRFLSGPEPLYRRTLLENFQGITPENEMKWETIEPQQGVFDYGPADELVEFALANEMSVHGHNLVWHQQLPSWLTSHNWTRNELMTVLREHIESVVGHFRGRVDEWDVVNEPFNSDGSLASDVFSTVIGPEYIALALRWAHAADPSASLFINDYDIDRDGPKRAAMLALLTTLKQEGVPLDGVGMEEHLSLNWSPSEEELEESMSSYAALGLKVEVTEMDVDTTGYQGSPEQAEAAQAEVFGNAARACRAVAACTRFSVWGVGDSASWLGPLADGLPFNNGYEPKPAWRAITAGLANP